MLIRMCRRQGKKRKKKKGEKRVMDKNNKNKKERKNKGEKYLVRAFVLPVEVERPDQQSDSREAI